MLFRFMPRSRRPMIKSVFGITRNKVFHELRRQYEVKSAACKPGRWAAVGLALLLCACTDTGQMTPLNDQAVKLGTPKFEFVRQGVSHGPITVTMPDGEVLHGGYQVIQGGAVGFGSGTAFGPGGAAYATGSSVVMTGGGAVMISASGDRGTIMTCRGETSFGHGGGTCGTVTGAEYQMMF